MSYLGDTLTVGLILILLFGSIALYLYTRVQQTEQKVGLLESIVLDLKLTGAIQSFTEPPFSSASLAPVSSSTVSPITAPLTPVSSSSSSSSSSLTPVSSAPVSSAPVSSVYTPCQDKEDQEQEKVQEQEQDAVVAGDIDFLPLDPVQQENIAVHSASQYDSLSLKELQAQVRSRGLLVERGAKKQALIELLKQQDANGKREVEPDQMISFSPLESTL